MAKIRRRTLSGDTDFPEKSVRHGRSGNKENDRPRERRSHTRASSSTSTAMTRTSRQTHSPKGNGKASLRKADKVDIADGLAGMSLGSNAVVPVIAIANATATIPIPKSPGGPYGQNGLLLPPTYPSNSIRLGANEDLNRFVSSSTATSGTTLTAGSAQSFVKHPGPGGNIRQIRPEEVQGMFGDRVGQMVFDKVMMKWVKSVPRRAEIEDERTELTRASTESEDPFRDIESLREDDDTKGGRGHEADVEYEMSRITETEREEVEDEEETDLNSFSFDSPSAGVVHVMTGVESDDLTTDSEDEDDRVLTEIDMDQHEYFDSDEEMPTATLPPAPQPVLSTPVPPRPHAEVSTPIPRNTPASALKNGSGSRTKTPTNRIGHRRSVSFSDGKREGPIRGVGKNSMDITVDKSIVLVPSTRSKRIADMMEDLESPGKLDYCSPWVMSLNVLKTKTHPQGQVALVDAQQVPTKRSPCLFASLVH